MGRGSWAQATWPDQAAEKALAWAGASLPLGEAGIGPGWRGWLGHPGPEASTECGSSALAPSGIPYGSDEEERDGPQALDGCASVSSEWRDWGPFLLQVADVRSRTPGAAGPGGRGHIRSDAPESPSRPHPHLRPPVQPVRPVSPVRLSRLPPPPEPREPRGGGGRAKGVGLSLKGSPATALRPLPGSGEDFSCCCDTPVRRRLPGS